MQPIEFISDGSPGETWSAKKLLKKVAANFALQYCFLN